MNIKVKICGIRDQETATTAITAGADYLGFNFVPSSPRYIDPKAAKEIISASKRKVLIVGVFQNASAEEVNKIADLLSLDFVQLHGKENADYLGKIQTKIIKKTAAKSLHKTNNITYFLLDRNIQGQGEMVDLERAAALSKKFPLFFAGGLTPKNVAEVVKKVRPFAVDVAGGIEANGRADPEKIRQFISTVKEIDI